MNSMDVIMESVIVLCLCSLAVIVNGQASSGSILMTNGVVSTAGMTATGSLSPTATPTGPPVTTAPNSQLSLIIGLPIGIGLAVLGLGACFIWLTCSAYCENKDNTRGTASSNLHPSNRSGGHSTPHYNSSSTGTDGRAFQPSSHPRPRQQPAVNPPPPVSTEEQQPPQELDTLHSEPTDEIDNPQPTKEPSTSSVDESQSEELSKRPLKSHGSTFDITLRSPEQSTTSLNQQHFDISFQQ